MLLVEALLLAAAALCYAFGLPNVAVAAIVLAMGLENAVFQIDGGAGLGLTYVTGALVKVGQLVAAALTGGARWGWAPNLLLWAALVAGSVCGALAYHWINLAAIWFAAGAALALSAHRGAIQRTDSLTATRLPDLSMADTVSGDTRRTCDDSRESRPRAACLIGWPAAHSRSPLIHHYWLRTLGIEGGYNIEAVPPEGFAEFVLHLSAHGFVGANVTIPHKERALALSTPDARARAVGAANTLWYDGGELRSTNTDVEGFIDNLDASAPGWDSVEEALVLGAGGSSRAVVFGLIERGIKRVHLANRTIERARALADQFGASVHPVAWDAIGDLLPRAGLLVNTTSLGMHGQPRSRSISACCRRMPWSPTSSTCRWKPPLLAAARARGLKTADGLGMLLHQAVRGFELWFGRRPRSRPNCARWSRPISSRFESQDH